MPDYPTIEKTWLYNVNQVLPVQGSADACDQHLLRAIVNSFIGFGGGNAWVVRGSCDSTQFSLPAQSAPAGTNFWTTDGALVWHNAPTAHSWIVLRQVNLGGTYSEILLTCNQLVSNKVLVWISPSAGFTGGSTTTDPTAVDGILLAQGGVSTTSFGSTFSNVAYALHVEMSSDGQCTRMWVFSGTTFQAMWIIDRVKKPVSGWTAPWVMQTDYLTPSSNSNWHNVSSTYGGGPPASTPGGLTYPTFQFYWTSEGPSNQLITVLNNASNDLNSEFPMVPIGLYEWTAESPPWGRHGMFYDLWWGCLAAISTPPYALYAGSIAHAYVQIGEYILPWDGSATMNTS